MNDATALSFRIPESLRVLPDWALSVAVLAFVALAAWWLHALVYRLAVRLTRDQSLFRRSVVTRTRGPTRFAFIMIALAFAAAMVPVPAREAVMIRQLMVCGLILLVGWAGLITLRIWTTLHLRRFKLDSEDNLLARKHVTQFRILKRVGEIIIVVVTVAAALMTFESVRQFGVGLLASAGAAGIVVGLALQPILKNLIAGVQLAITQPIRIDDALLVENEWGNVEEITSTYVVLRIWDWRRLIVPLSYFIETPFQNWTREGAALIGTVFLYVDFTVPVDKLRTELEAVLRRSALWDGNVVCLQVTDFKEHTMEIRMLMSARDSPRVFDLRCEVREAMIAYVQKTYPHALPRLRADLNGAAPEHVPLGDGGLAHAPQMPAADR